jgi:Cys-rich repeat protein
MSEAIRRPFGRRCPRKTRWLMGAGVGASIVAASGASAGATWINARTTPRLSEIVAIDSTGESGWPYGQEDVAGDGPLTFAAPEQMIDIRTAYAATDASRFWARVYFSDPNGVGAGVTAYVFIDADRNVATGGRAIGAEINPAFTTDPSPGGYDFVLAVGGNGAVAGLWAYQAMQGMYATLNPTAANSSGETGADADPILIDGAQHGYVQMNADLNVVGLTSTCDANVFVRSVNAGAGDLEAGQLASCIPADANRDGVPDIVIPPAGCTSDAQCPAGGTCNNGVCTVPPTCTIDADCPATDQCVAGRCVPRPGGTCTTSAQCGDLVCTNGQCVACVSNPECGTGRICASTGRCVGNVVLAPGEKVEGGAFHCAVSARKALRLPLDRRDVPPAAAAVVAALALAARRRRTRLS